MQPHAQHLCSMKYSDKDKIFSEMILFEDNHLCIAIKPAGMVVPIENDPQNSLEGYLKRLYQKKLGKEAIFLRPIHRLDKPVCGIVVFARSSKALKRLHEAQRNKTIQKYYLACVTGEVQTHSKILNHQLVHGNFRAEVVAKGGKNAQLKYRSIVKKQSHSLLAVRLMTGRYHQIRAQLSAMGHPIIGDQKIWRKRQRQRLDSIVPH